MADLVKRGKTASGSVVEVVSLSKERESCSTVKTLIMLKQSRRCGHKINERK